MRKSQELSQRMIRYLSSLGHGVWVMKALLRDHALKNKYSDGMIRDAFGDLDNTPDIGYRYADGEARYCWYQLTPEQRERHKKQRELFSEL